MAQRPEKDLYYLNIAKEIAMRSTCLRRKFGAVIVNRDQIVSTGYCGAPRGTLNCSDIKKCLREELDIPHGANYELCRAVHAEQNAIIHASRLDMIGSTLYLAGIDVKTNRIAKDSEPCRICKRLIINSGIEKVIILKTKNDFITVLVNDWIKSNIEEISILNNEYKFEIKPGY